MVQGLQGEGASKLASDSNDPNSDVGASDDSGSLTERAALIRDELLGNDSVDQDTERVSASSSSTTGDENDTTSQKGSEGNEGDLEERLGTSSIAHSLRHIALAFDEKTCELESLRRIHQAHEEECAMLKAKLGLKEKENDDLTIQVHDLIANNDSIQSEMRSLRLEIEHKDELLCLSDRISSRLFDKIHAIRAQVEAAESLSPAIRSLTVSPTCADESDLVFASSSSIDDSATSVVGSETSPNPELPEVAADIEQMMKEIEAKYAPEPSDN